MANWHEILWDVTKSGSTLDVIRRRYLKELHEITGRNVIIYYSGWLQQPSQAQPVPIAINDEDKNGFMNAIHNLDRSLGLDLVLHTPGGEVSATESLVDYLRSMFDTNIRAIVPQLAMSGGTMIACACQEILMGKQSSLGPVDPQYNGLPAHGVVEEFKRAHEEIKKDQTKAYIWQPILQKYPPTFIGECEKAMEWSKTMIKEWLLSGMLADKENAGEIAARIEAELTDHALTLSHSRHLSMKRCMDIGLVVKPMEEDQKLQDAVLSLHHACMQTFSATPAIKIIENHNGIAYIKVHSRVLPLEMRAS
jgi:ClpP class serine protease